MHSGLKHWEIEQIELTFLLLLLIELDSLVEK